MNQLSILYYQGSFVFTEYKTGLQLGTSENIDHNGVLSNAVSTLVQAFIRFGYKALRNLPNLEFAFISRTIRELNGDTFVYCYKLRTVVFEEHSELEAMSYYIFYSSGIQSITFPSSVKTLDFRSFYNCTSLQSIIITGMLYSDDNTIFEMVTQRIKIYVPSNYKWESFGGKAVMKLLPPYYDRPYCQTCKHHSLLLPTIHVTILIMI